MAFGTGLHPTTRLCLAGIEAWADRGLLDRGAAARGGSRVLDVGCGSGILAIAAGLFGAEELVGLDTDPIAIEATLANARRNRLGRRVVARQGSLPSGEPPFDLVLANLIASVLDRRWPDRSPPSSGRAVGCSPRGSSSTARPRSAPRSPPPGSRSIGRSAEGDWVALESCAD